jgi:hypothetical protein
MAPEQNLSAIIIVKYKGYMGGGYYDATVCVTPHSVELKQGLS